MAYFKLLNNNKNEYIVNSNKTILYIFNKEKNKLVRYFKDSWSSRNMKVVLVNNDNEMETTATLEDIVENNDFIHTCQVISSTLKPTGVFEEEDDFAINTTYLNEFLGSVTFLNCLNDNKYSIDSNPIELLKSETPTIYTLLANLFHNEKEEVLLNFIKWLKVVGFEDKHQDIMWLFFGTNEENQGQGAGKGVLRDLLSEMFSGLVASVSNTSYLNNFNSNLMNKKIVIFDEMDLKSLKYEKLKDISGNPVLMVEVKSKEAIKTENVSSWLCFSNQWDLYNTVTQEDRRMFIIRPNPINNSLKKIINDNYEDFNNFNSLLHSEIENFIHIISLVDTKVLSPIELITNAKIDYFKSKSNASVKELEDLGKIFTNKNVRKKLYDIFGVILDIDSSKQNDITDIKKVIELNFVNYKTFRVMFELLQKFEYINKSAKLNQQWELTKEKLLSNNFISKRSNLKATKKYASINETILVKKETSPAELKKINLTRRKIFIKNDCEVF